MATMVERVARAICAKTNIADWGESEPRLDNPDAEYMAWVQGQGYVDPKPRWTLYIEQARAAIEAMRAFYAEANAALKGMPKLFEIRDKTGEAPCYECHIQPGETCDICGAAAPAEALDADKGNGQT